jgi:hypothetical protein
MLSGHLLPGTLGLCLLSGLIGSTLAAGAAGAAGDGSPKARLALHRLQSNFHEAGVTGDYELMLGSWADDGVFSNPAGTIEGAEAIAAWFAETPGWGKQVALSPAYKTSFDVHGNSADFTFECVFVAVVEGDPMDASLAPGPGNGRVGAQIVGHTRATGTAVRQGEDWVFKSFTGGPITPAN